MTNIGNIFKTEYTPEFHSGNRSYAGKILHVDLSTGETHDLQMYFKQMGWDERGTPSRAALAKLDMAVVQLATGRIHAHL